jgi:hypothetical protein
LDRVGGETPGGDEDALPCAFAVQRADELLDFGIA